MCNHHWEDKWQSPQIPQPTDAKPDSGATCAKNAQVEADMLSRNLDHVSTEWVQLHQEMSRALELDFEPEEDIERYTEAIAALRADLASAKAENRRLRAFVTKVANVTRIGGEWNGYNGDNVLAGLSLEAEHLKQATALQAGTEGG